MYLEDKIIPDKTSLCTAYIHGEGLNLEDGFIASSQISVRSNQVKHCEGAVCVGKFVAYDILDNGEYSRAALQQRVIDEYNKLPDGTIIDCRITALAHYGAFVDIGYGVSALIYIDEISLIKGFSSVFLLKPDLVIRAVKLPNGDDGKRFLSLRMLLPTFDEYMEQIHVGDVVVGIVDSTNETGTFIALGCNLVGMTDDLVGLEKYEKVSVLVRHIQPERGKVKLSIVSKQDKKAELPLPIDYGKNASLSRITHWEYNSSNPDCRRKRTFKED